MLHDRFGRSIDCLRLSARDRCGKSAWRPLQRGGAGDAGLEEAIRHAIEPKPEKHEFHEQPGKIVRCMAQTGR